MGGNYEKGMYHQLMDVMARLDAMESEHRKDRRDIKTLTGETQSLQKENTRLRETVSSLKEENRRLGNRCGKLERENAALRDDNERMKRERGNDSSNSSMPPSAEPPWKAANTYNSRKPTKRKRGAQAGHKGAGLSKEEVEKKIQEGTLRHKVCDIGDKGNAYVTRYRIDLECVAVATEYRIHASQDGKYEIPDGLRGDVTYGDNVRAVAAYLYGEGVVSIGRIRDFIHSLSGDAITVSAGAVYGFCRRFSAQCAALRGKLEEKLLDSHEICTDATPVTNNGKMNYIRNFSTGDVVLYSCSRKKDLPTLRRFPVLRRFAGVFCHDHETALYHFGTGHAECNVHLCRYLRKNTEETGNPWSHDMESFLNGMNTMRSRRKAAGAGRLTAGELERYSGRYDQIVAAGRGQNQTTRGRIARKEEKALLNRLEKYKANHLLFLYDFQVHYSNNMSEKDLRICKNREKMAGGFRTAEGMQMYCDIMSFLETVKRRKENIFQSIAALMGGKPVNI